LHQKYYNFSKAFPDIFGKTLEEAGKIMGKLLLKQQ
jgi:hypothetical protein